MLPYRFRPAPVASRYDGGFQDLHQSDGGPVKDLNNLLKISTDSYRKNAKVADNVMRFLAFVIHSDLFPMKTPYGVARGLTGTVRETLVSLTMLVTRQQVLPMQASG